MKPQALSGMVQAALCVTSAMALIGYADNLVPKIATHMGLWQFHVLRAAMALPAILVLAWVTGWSVRPKRVWAVALRGALLAASMVFYFGSLSLLTVSQAVAGLFMAPLWVLAIERIVLGIRPRRSTVLAALLGIAGALLVLKPDITSLDWVILMPIAGGVFYAIQAVLTRRLCAQEGTLALMLGFLVALMVLSAMGALWIFAQPGSGSGADAPFWSRGWVMDLSAAAWGLTAIQACVVIVGVGLITRGYLLAAAPQVAIFEYTLLVFAALWGWLLWGQTIDVMTATGIALIFLSGAVLVRATAAHPVPV